MNASARSSIPRPSQARCGAPRELAAAVAVAAALWATAMPARGQPDDGAREAAAIEGQARPRPAVRWIGAARAPELARCERRIAQFVAAVEAAGVADRQSARVPGVPYLRADRWLASHANERLSAAAHRRWIDRLEALDAAAREHEARNLPPAERARLLATFAADGDPEPALAVVQRCRAAMRAADDAHPALVAARAARVSVDDAYDDLARLVGLYPLLRWPAMVGVRAWHDEARARLGAVAAAAPAASAASAANRLRLAPADAPAAAGELVELFGEAVRSPLGELEFPPEVARRIAGVLAPVIEVAQAGPDDVAGTPVLDADGRPAIDSQSATVTWRLAHTRVDDRILPQFVYTVWFPGRTASAPIDPLAGRLDAVVWRVTLDVDARVVMHDTMHACGCWHLFLPVPGVQPRQGPDRWTEIALVPHAPAAAAAGERMQLLLEAGTHALQAVAAVPADGAAGRRYLLLDEDRLRSLPQPGGGTRSFYDDAGLVPGSERLERLFLWPLGVRSAGSLRQWGSHATAFVGRRHFDDARLLDERFVFPAPAPLR